ncbi:hypothetical protein OLP57_03270 [Campylobacter jejuni]|uniref:hypothetical protein n=1 Tax=Campylobacter TaxID=194 RepID=UPI000874CFA4|nr:MULTISPECIES: hypothetical protein [Campylobacter]EAB5248484.1 hypothetical protein [Campylobacter jejuni]EAK7750510.1 hypothetical protein [Campylobacter jejuni]EDP2686384.1 hypothetical protein [Campylobacter jejuni]MCW1341908.1 hypothetical protein [Campylobacter jejuni]OEW03897.1 hypothetical protein AJ930_07680 [Campylobacter sp. BCW_6871]
MRNIGYIDEFFRKILKDEDRNTVKCLQKALCNVILARYDDFAKDYKCFRNFKQYQTFEECLAFIFQIELNRIEKTLSLLEEFKNIQNDITRCMNVKIDNL